MAETPRVAAVGELLPFTRWTIIDLEPVSLERLAGYLHGLLEREPMKSSPGYLNERIVLGCLVTDLRTIVMDAGEPVGPARDLRDARTKGDEKMARERMERATSAYHDLITDAIETDQRVREVSEGAAHGRDPEVLEASLAPVEAAPAADHPSWL